MARVANDQNIEETVKELLGRPIRKGPNKKIAKIATEWDRVAALETNRSSLQYAHMRATVNESRQLLRARVA